MHIIVQAYQKLDDVQNVNLYQVTKYTGLHTLLPFSALCAT